MSVPISPKATSPGPKPRRSYHEEFKREAVKLAESIGATQAAHALGIERSLVSSWKKSLATESKDAFRGEGHPTEEQPEMLRLRRGNATLRTERELLKKAAEFFMREPS